jgi:hypothetical protein
MKKLPVFSTLFNWLYATELFARPARQLPGRWKLYEYYTEPGGQLINLKEEQLKEASLYLELNFEKHGKLGFEMNLPLRFFDDIARCSWFTSRNFLIIACTENSDTKEEFQYAIDKGKLKLLKKNSDGKIEFFGFFRKIERKD